jgi:hypothetical protein
VLRLILIITSLISAAGNYAFLIGLEDQESYMFYLSFSSCFSGLFCYGFLPVLSTKYRPTTVLAVIVATCFFASLMFLGVFSLSAALVVSTIFLFLCTEIVLSSDRAWRKISYLRVAMLTSGVISWVYEDFLSISLRFAVVLLASAFLSMSIMRRNSIRVTIAKSQIRLLALVLINLTWVYLLPLFLIDKLETEEQLFVYMGSTIIPLIYFKAQDAVFKLDIVGGGKSGRFSSLAFLLVFAVPLVLFYICFFPLSVYGVISAPLDVVAIFSISSTVFLIMNIYLTNSLSHQSDAF